MFLNKEVIFEKFQAFYHRFGCKVRRFFQKVHCCLLLYCGVSSGILHRIICTPFNCRNICLHDFKPICFRYERTDYRCFTAPMYVRKKKLCAFCNFFYSLVCNRHDKRSGASQQTVSFHSFRSSDTSVRSRHNNSLS